MKNQFSRRDALARVAGLGAGIASILKGQTQSKAGSNEYPQVPSWKTELKPLAPNVFAYTQARWGHPGRLSRMAWSSWGPAI